MGKLRNNVQFHSLEQKSPLNVFIEKIGESFEEILVLCGKSVLQKVLNIKNGDIGAEMHQYLENLLREQRRSEIEGENETKKPPKPKVKSKQQLKREWTEQLIENSHRV